MRLLAARGLPVRNGSQMQSRSFIECVAVFESMCACACAAFTNSVQLVGDPGTELRGDEHDCPLFKTLPARNVREPLM